jgi:rRNA maturation protein Rpf1
MIESAKEKDYTDVVVINEDRRVPSKFFSLFNVKFSLYLNYAK